jgi:site-specific DNA-methyltransferase (adenine-specific)
MKYLKDIKDWKEMKNQVICADCLDGMKLIPDKSIDLILTDPPYGIGASKGSFMRQGKQTGKSKCVSGLNYTASDWDNEPPNKEAFNEIFRISENQVVFGGNYFVEYLYNSPCWIVWDKNNGNNRYADCELAWTSFKTAVRKFKHTWHGMIQENMKHKDMRVHPTQKPVELMRWILENYSKEGDLICDPFMGSWTMARACKDLGRDFIGFELDENYCKIGEKRLQQEVLF